MLKRIQSRPFYAELTKCFTRGHGQQPMTERQKELMARSLPKRKPLQNVGHVIIVASGKGGVGKTTTAVNLAVALGLKGLQIGLLDADIFGPSVPLMMNLKDAPLVNEQNLMIPLVNYGIKCNSMGLLVDTGPVIWRGPLVMSALQRLLLGTIWDPCDILIVDTPPGTGDVHLSLCQHIPVAGVLLVSTPQQAALEVTSRGADMFKTLKVPLIGLAENMSYVKCTNCATNIDMFRNSTDKYAKQMGVEVLERMPMEGRMAESSDKGKPIVLSEPESDNAMIYKRLADKVTQFLKLSQNRQVV